MSQIIGRESDRNSRDDDRVASRLASPMSRAQIVYYLCRAGKMEPPHMIEVQHSSYDGLRLRDVKQRLTALRGSGMPQMFSWSYKRVYKNTHLWQDVSEDDYLHPVAGGEYILKGSEYLENFQEKSSKPVITQCQVDNTVKNPEVFQRKFRGAETWLKGAAPVSPKNCRDQNSQTVVCQSYERAPKAPEVETITYNLRKLGMESSKRHHAANDEYVSDQKTSCATGSSEDSSMQDIKVCEVVRSPNTAAATNTGEMATQTDYACGVSQSSGNSTPICFGHRMHSPISAAIAPTTMQMGKASKAKKKLKHGKESGPNVKMKHSATSCAFLHILSYCGGVETKVQGTTTTTTTSTSAPPTEFSSSSEYSCEGVCRPQQAQLMKKKKKVRSPPLEDNHVPYNTRSGPLIPYSSEYFDVKEAVTPPLQSSPLCKSSSKAISRTSSHCGAQDDESISVPQSRSCELVMLEPRTSPSTSTVAAAASKGPWKKKLRVSKRRFVRHWWQVFA